MVFGAGERIVSSVTRYEPHYTVEDYLQWEGEWELWYGVAVSMSPSPFGPHELVVSRLVQDFRNQIDKQNCHCEVYAGLDWIVASDTVVRPDVMIVCGDQPTRHLERPPVIAVEVLSPSTASKDSFQKRELYQYSGVSYYLIVDPDNRTLQILRLLDGFYHVMMSSLSSTHELDHGCKMELEVERLFR